MILLKNFDFAKKYFDFEMQIEKELENIDVINGWYKIIDSILTGVLVQKNKLYFLYGSDKYHITKDHNIVLKKTDSSKNIKTLILFDKKNKIVSYSYTDFEENLYPTPFDYIDDEDSKWEYFIEKIINDEERKNNFISNLMEIVK
ncbi:hypothetical protein HN014_10835 [Aquimarina sp. TRL1]|uniref:hypothetical protein n=1 Tax=Aquimarina sp. (strain TRL1) TaxID=2736252 RepID=UPI001588B1E0|nr:hypothetical protein [Aquimarina sp. TRL1]QKX05388.1 hypothetical protein HN014_10835 [Aquimarina sp. TRL1]